MARSARNFNSPSTAEAEISGDENSLDMRFSKNRKITNSRQTGVFFNHIFRHFSLTRRE